MDYTEILNLARKQEEEAPQLLT